MSMETSKREEQTEIVDIVDDENVVIGKISEADLYKCPNNHRIVHVLIFNDNGEMALQLRSRTDDYLPLHWTTVVGGHVQAGETPEQAAKREMREEIGVDIPFEKLFETAYELPQVPGMKKFLTVFRATYNGPFSPNLKDIERVEFFSQEKIRQMINNQEKVHQEFAYIFFRANG